MILAVFGRLISCVRIEPTLPFRSGGNLGEAGYVLATSARQPPAPSYYNLPRRRMLQTRDRLEIFYDGTNQHTNSPGASFDPQKLHQDQVMNLYLRLRPAAFSACHFAGTPYIAGIDTDAIRECEGF